MNPEMMRQMVERMAAQRAASTGRQNMPMMPGMSGRSGTRPAPQGSHYMPDGTLMKDSDMGSASQGGMDNERRLPGLSPVDPNDPYRGDGMSHWPNYVEPADQSDPARGDATATIQRILAMLRAGYKGDSRMHLAPEWGSNPEIDPITDDDLDNYPRMHLAPEWGSGPAIDPITDDDLDNYPRMHLAPEWGSGPAIDPITRGKIGPTKTESAGKDAAMLNRAREMARRAAIQRMMSSFRKR